MWYNLYYNDIVGDMQKIGKLSIEGVVTYTQIVLNAGGEITGIINMEND